MGFLAKLGSLFRKQEAELTPEEKAALEAVKAQIRERCRRFRSLLSANKRALETMSEMEEHLEAATAVFQMIREINGLTKNAYPELNGAFARISARIEAATAPKAHPAEGPLVLPLEQISLADIREVGGKMANLGEVASGAGLPVPPGFAVTVSAYRLFLKENGLAAEIEKRIRATDMDSLDQVFQLSAGLQQAVQAAPLPAMLEDAIWNHL